MEIVWITENYYPNKGGMAQSCDRIVNGLRKAEVKIHLLHFSDRHSQIEVHKQFNGSYMVVPVRGNYPHSLQIGFHLLQKEVPHTQKLVAFGGFLPILCVSTYAQWLKIPYLVCIRGNDFDTAIFHYQRREVLLNTLQSAQYVIANSTEKAQKIHLLLKQDTVKFIPNGIESDWQASEQDKQWAKTFREQHPAQKIIGFFGQLKEKKGLLFFLNAVHQAQLTEQLFFILVGEIDENTNQFIENQGFNFLKLDFLDRFRLIPYYLACDWVGLPSFYDGMPNVLLEAMALGVPVIASCVDGMRDVIQSGKNGLLFENLSTADLVHTLHYLQDLSEEAYQTIAHNAFQTARQVFTLENEIQHYKKLIEQQGN